MIPVHLLSGKPQTRNARNIFRAGAQIPLLAAAVKKGLNLYLFIYIEKPTPFGPWILWPLTLKRSIPCFLGRITILP